MNRSRRVASRADAIACPIKLMAPSFFRFLPGTPFDPPRAGMTPNVNGFATRLDLHPALLGGRTLCRLDHEHRAQAVPAVARRLRFTANDGDEVPGLLDVHVVELLGEREDLPRVLLRVEHTDLVLEASPLQHAGLAREFEVALHVPREQVHVNVADRAGC